MDNFDEEINELFEEETLFGADDDEPGDDWDNEKEEKDPFESWGEDEGEEDEWGGEEDSEEGWDDLDE